MTSPVRVAANDERDAADAKLLGALAVAHSLFGRHETAGELLDLARWIDPECSRTLELMAVVRLREGRYAEAVEVFEALEADGVPLADELDAAKRRAKAIVAARADASGSGRRPVR